MINVWIPYDREFYKYRNECKELYESVQDKIGDGNSFDFICENTFFYLFETDGNLIGGIYYFEKPDGKLYLNAFAKRKMHPLCIKCLKTSVSWFRENIYAEAKNRASAICLIRAGFRRSKENIFCYNRL